VNTARAQYFAWRGASLAIPALPSPVDPLLARAVGGLAYAGAPNARAAVRANLEVVAPRLSRAEREILVRRTFVQQARNYLTTLRLPRMRRRRHGDDVTVNGFANLEQARAGGAGIVVASAHFGPLPSVGARAVAAHDLDVTVVAESIPPKLFELLNRNLRGALGATFVPATQLMTLVRTLRRGGIIAILADRTVAGSGMRIELFGRPALLPTGHVQIAARAGAPLVPTFALPGPPPSAEVQPALELVPGKDDEATRENLRRWVARLEPIIAGAPEEWHVFERIWPDPSDLTGSDRMSRIGGVPDR
jgi:KDO2-lipid IV(A) lauroyltransferase